MPFSPTQSDVLVSLESPRAVPASGLRLAASDKRAQPQLDEATTRRHRDISLRSRRDPTSPSSVAFDLSPEFLLCAACALLQTSEQLVFLAFGVSKIIVGELRVSLLQLSLNLVPSAFECEFVHTHFSLGTSVPVARKRLSGTRAPRVVGEGFFRLCLDLLEQNSPKRTTDRPLRLLVHLCGCFCCRKPGLVIRLGALLVFLNPRKS
jgi:hypothetical protein